MQQRIYIVSFLCLFLCSCAKEPEGDFFITLRSPSPNSILINWKTKLGVSSYKIYKFSPFTKNFEYLATTNDSTYLDSGLLPSTEYEYKLSYIDDNSSERYVEKTFFATTQPYIIAHRGYWDGVDGSAENSIQSLKQASKLDVYGCEFDVHLTLDNVPVIHHDYNIEGKNIHTLTFNSIKDIVISNGEKLPTLDEYLRIGKDLSIRLILEIKPHGSLNRDSKAAQIIYDKVKEFSMEERVEYISFSLNICRELIRLSSKNNVGFLFDNGENISQYGMKEYGFSYLSIEYSFLMYNQKYIDKAKDLGLEVHTWTVNDINTMENLVKQGIGYIVTDKPLAAKEHFEQKEYKYMFENI